MADASRACGTRLFWLALTASVLACGGDLHSTADAADSGRGDDDTASPSDAAPDGGAPDAESPYHALGDETRWSIFDTTTVNPAAQGFLGAAFDGRYVYLAPNVNNAKGYDGIVTRYDTQSPFDSPPAWATFDTTTVDARARGFAGASYDGRYLYLVPDYNVAPDGIVARYDVQAPFTASTSWSTFDVATVDPAATGFLGAAFDGRFMYFSPYAETTVARFDTQASLGAAASWSTYDAGAIGVRGTEFFGAVYDGRDVYFVPYATGYSGLITRYDAAGPFTSGASWSSYDLSALDPSAKGFRGGAYDGRYLYLVPNEYDVAARFDTQGPLASAASWTMFDPTTVDPLAKGFCGAGFDGRYVYLVPFADGHGSLLTRYDTQLAFAGAAAWSTFDTTTLGAGVEGFCGAAFDGRYLYLVPAYGGVVARFDARTPPAMPKGFSGSFL